MDRWQRQEIFCFTTLKYRGGTGYLMYVRFQENPRSPLKARLDIPQCHPFLSTS